MPKIKKKTKKNIKSKKASLSEEKFAFKSVIISVIFGGVFLVLSLFFNGTDWFVDGIITKFAEKEIYWEILDISIKVSVIVLAFFFMMVSIGNYKELTGKPIRYKEILLLLGLSLAQTIRNLYVFLFTLISLALILFYLYMVQE